MSINWKFLLYYSLSLILFVWFIYCLILANKKRSKLQYRLINDQLCKIIVWSNTCYNLLKKDLPKDEQLAKSCLLTLLQIQHNLDQTIDFNFSYLNKAQFKLLSKVQHDYQLLIHLLTSFNNSKFKDIVNHEYVKVGDLVSELESTIQSFQRTRNHSILRYVNLKPQIN